MEVPLILEKSEQPAEFPAKGILHENIMKWKLEIWFRHSILIISPVQFIEHSVIVSTNSPVVKSLRLSYPTLAQIELMGVSSYLQPYKLKTKILGL